ncbi:MAG: glycerol-3-phosphate dehydrogenase subunit GlpB [Caldilineales bacterium]|nr:glycerol-3-phosphate dehydrogenase subunit GlpB [Caldilineales bacterium]MCW5859634.1 glycerol-3-phosphate dehydrogenase subunit GlpB [Caldilineales bacterium]
MNDVLVIGAGLSGLTAAYTVAQTGLKAKVIAKGLGSLHWGAGTIDLFGYAPLDPQRPIARPLDFIAGWLAENQPQHPYALLGARQVQAALDSFAALTSDMGLPYIGAQTSGDNLLLPTAVGAARPTFLAPQSQLAGDLSRDEPMLIVGFAGLRDFYPHLVAENLGKAGQRARAALLPFDLLTDRNDSNTVQQAQGMDDPARRGKLAAAIKKIVQPGERVGLPPILGLEAPTKAWADVQQQVGAPVFEIPTLPPSVPGMRLYMALRDRLRQMGVRVEIGLEARGAATRNGHIEWVETATTARPLKHSAQQFVLATGGIMGGGFDSDHTGRVWEVIFDLPLTTPQQRSKWFRPAFINPDGHPVYTGGVLTDARMQPLEGAGNLVYDNLWAVGDLLANDNPILQRSLEGAALATGYAAGLRIAQMSRK